MRLWYIKRDQAHPRETTCGKEPVSALAANFKGWMVKSQVSDTEIKKSGTGNRAGLHWKCRQTPWRG